MLTLAMALPWRTFSAGCAGKARAAPGMAGPRLYLYRRSYRSQTLLLLIFDYRLNNGYAGLCAKLDPVRGKPVFAPDNIMSVHPVIDADPGDFGISPT